MSQNPRRDNPYTGLPDRQFWRPAVGNRRYDEIDALWRPKVAITDDTAFATYGSCFAQHFGQALNKRGAHWVVTEPAPKLMSVDDGKRFNFGVFSSRTGNIYTTSLLRQWVSWADGSAVPPEEIWVEGGRVYDPFRPAIEPEGFADAEELRRTRAVTLEAFANSIRRADVFVFTLGLTESWMNIEQGYEYPMCPGTHAGRYDPAAHRFVNQDYPEVARNLRGALDAMRAMNPGLRFLLTVSPVPLTATNSGDHVLVATSYSKSVLRAVAGRLAQEMADVDYFPSYEIVNAPSFGGRFFKPNQRNITPEGVDFVIEHFFAGVAGGSAGTPTRPAPETDEAEAAGEVCEEALLEAFGPKQ